MPHLVKSLHLLLFAVLLAACSSTPSKDEESEADGSLPDLNAQVDVDVAWRRQLGEGSGSVYSRLKVAVNDERIYAADPQGSVYALALEDAELQWQVSLDYPITAGVTFHNDQLFVATQDGQLHCLSASDGKEIWQATLTSEAIAPAGADDDRVFVHTIDGRVSAFERADGHQAWSYEHAMPILTVRGTGAPLVLDEIVVTGFATGKVLGLDKKLGIPRWNVRLASPDGRSELERLVDVDGTPHWNEGRIYAASYHGKIASMSINGDVDWEEDGSSYTSPAMALGSVYLTLDDSTIQSYDQNNGAVQWQQTALQQRDVSQTTVSGSYLIVGDNEGYIHVLRQVDGDLVGRRLIRPRPLHINYPNQSEATRWRLLRGKDFGIRNTLVDTEQGTLVYTNSGELLLLTLEEIE